MVFLGYPPEPAMSGTVERNVVEYYSCQGPSEGYVRGYDTAKGENAVKQYRRIVLDPAVRIDGATAAAIAALNAEPDGRLYWTNNGANKATVGDWVWSDGTSADVPGNDFSHKSLLFKYVAGPVELTDDTAGVLATFATPTYAMSWLAAEKTNSVARPFWCRNPVITVTATFESNGTGIRKLGLARRDGSQPLWMASQPATAATGATVTLTGTFPFIPGLYGTNEVSAVGYQNSGGALDATNIVISIAPVGSSCGLSGPGET